ncbi:MAG: sigma factor-like helix-turn-helix DNA-binding protein, partial [Clostridium sp.]
LEFNNIIKDLNKREKYIIEKFYKDRDSIIEIAKDLNLSRQFVNRVKNEALEKLKFKYKKIIN